MNTGGASRAGMWSAADVVSRQGVQFAVSILLARLLTPEDFGIIALLLFFTGFGAVVIQAGFGTALIQRQNTSRDQESAVFWLSLLSSFAIVALLLAAAPVLAAFYNQPVLEPLMWLAALQVIAGAIGTVPVALLTRMMRFDKLAAAGLAAAILSGFIGITAALLGAGVWALAFQSLAAALINTAVIWWLSGWSPRFRLRRVGALPLVAFGSRVSLSNLIDHLYVQGFALTLGKLHGVADLGLYNRAHSTQHFAAGTLASILGRFALPLFASRAENSDLLRETVGRSVRIIMLVNLPFMVGLIVLSDLVILALFGPAWSSSSPILSVLAVAGILWPLHVINIQLLLALNRPDLFWKVELTKKSIGVALVIGGSAFGVMGLAISQVIFAVFAHFFNGYFTAKMLRYGPLRQLGDVFGTAVCALMMGAALWWIKPKLTTGPFTSLVTLAAIGVIVFFSTALSLRVRSLSEGLAAVRYGIRPQHQDQK